MAGSLMGLAGAWVSGTPGGSEHGVNRLLERPAVPFPVDGKHRDEGLGGTPGPLSTELHGVLFSDYNIIPPGGGPHEPLQVCLAIRVMVLVRHELHARAGRPELLREALRVGDPCSRHHAPSSEHAELLARAGSHTLEMTNHEPHRADRRPPPRPPPPPPPPHQPPRPRAPPPPPPAFSPPHHSNPP